MILTEESDVTDRTPWLTNLFTQDKQDYTTMEGGNRQNMLFRDIKQDLKRIRIFYFRNKQIENLVLGLLLELRLIDPSFNWYPDKVGTCTMSYVLPDGMNDDVLALGCTVTICSP